MLAPWLSKAHSALHRAQTGREGTTASQRKLWAKALDFQSQNSNTNLWHLVSTKVRVFFFSWVSFTSSCRGDSFSLSHYFMHFSRNFIALGAGLVHVGYFSLLGVWYTEVISFKLFLLEVVSMNCKGYEGMSMNEWLKHLCGVQVRNLHDQTFQSIQCGYCNFAVVCMWAAVHFSLFIHLLKSII